MCSLVSAIIANLVMKYVETKALTTFRTAPCWCRRYVDDSNACIKSQDLCNFHRRLNAVNPHTKFTVERANVVDNKQTIAFLDTSISILPDGQAEVDV